MDCQHVIGLIVDQHLELPVLKCVKCVVGRLVEVEVSELPEGIGLVSLTSLENYLRHSPAQVDKIKPGITEYLLATRPVARVDTRMDGKNLTIDKLWLEDGTVISLSGARVTNIEYERKD